MKASAIVRIVLYSLLFLILLSLLLGGIFAGKFISQISSWIPSGEEDITEHSVNADAVSKLEIDWAAGSIKILTADTDQITVKEAKDSNNRYTMVAEHDDETLKIRYTRGNAIHFGNLSGKDLTIIVPRNWNCKELTIDGAALEIDISDLTVDSLDLDGAAAKLTFNGSLDELECNGAAAELNLECNHSPSKISIDGAACKLDLTLPVDCGYRVDTDGLAIDFQSNCAYETHNDAYTYGNANCRIDISGLGCKVTVDEAQ